MKIVKRCVTLSGVEACSALQTHFDSAQYDINSNDFHFLGWS